MTNLGRSKSEIFFGSILRYPWLIIICSLLMVIGFGSQLAKIKMDTSIEAFIPPGHESLKNRDEVRKLFGLSDPIVVALVNDSDEGIFTPELLNFVDKLTSEFKKVEGVDPEKITSLSTENNIYGTSTGMIVSPFINGDIKTQEEASLIRKQALDFPLYNGSIISNDGTTTLLIVELTDKLKYGEQAYHEIKALSKELLNQHVVKAKAEVHVAGEGGIIAYQAGYIDQDAKKLTPLAFLVILVVLTVAYRTFRGVYITIFIIIGSVVSAIGIMSGVGIPMFITSNIIPVILITISVADSVHILGMYYELVAKYPDKQAKEIVVLTMKEMWRPVTFTSLTNVAGFLALGFTSIVPPLNVIGVFSSIGVLIAWILSMLLIPAILMLLKLKSSSAYKEANNLVKVDVFGRLTKQLGKVIKANPKGILIASVVVFIISTYGASLVYVDEASIDNFHSSTDIHKADRIINTKMNGSNSFDVMISTDDIEALYNPENLKKVEKLQEYIESIPNVSGTTSIIDIIKQMNKSLNENENSAYVIPEDEAMVAQLFLLYSVSANPNDLERFIDFDYQHANISVTLKDGKFTTSKKIIEQLQQHLDSSFNSEVVNAKIAGWMNVFYHWQGSIEASNYLGLALALLAVLILTTIAFRSLQAGLFAVLPVLLAILILYAIMGYANITLNTATSIFGAIAIGVSVDFAIHIIESIKFSVAVKKITLGEALDNLFLTTGRALFFNVMAVCLGFGINMISSLPPLVTFGALITACVASSFIASITIIPSLIKTFNPSFLYK